MCAVFKKYKAVFCITAMLICGLSGVAWADSDAGMDGIKTVLDISQGDISISNSSVTTGGTTQEADADGYIITGTTSEYVVQISGTHSVVLKNLSIQSASRCAFDVSGATVQLELSGENFLQSGSSYAGLQKNGTAGTMTISGTGKLTAIGGSAYAGGAGIGSQAANTTGNIIIENGTIIARGGTGHNGAGAGIGAGGVSSSAENIVIHGGNIHAAAGLNGAAGIGGGGHDGKLSGLVIDGGWIIARGQYKHGQSGNNGQYNEAVPIGGGAGISVQETSFSDVTSGIIFNGTTGEGRLFGTRYMLANNAEIPEGYRLNLAQGQSFVIPEGVKLIVNGSIQYRKGILNAETITGPAQISGATGIVRNDIQIQPSVIDFGSVFCEYTVPAEQMVTVKNTGTEQETGATASESLYFLTEQFSAKDIAAGDSITFTVQPKAGLSADCYQENLFVTTDSGTTTSAQLMFCVTHNYQLTYDELSHWNACVCGSKTETTDHLDTDSNGYCDTCEWQMQSGNTGSGEAGIVQQPSYGGPVAATPAYDKRIVLQIGSCHVKVNGHTRMTDAAPFILEGRTYVPVRLIVETLGGKVQWVEETRTVILNIDGKSLKMTIGQIIPGFDAAPVIKENRTYIPVRYVAEQLGAHVLWTDSSRTVYIEK